MLVCPECAHEWSASDSAAATGDQDKVIKDAVGNTLQDGDTVTVIKDLKVKGSSLVVKVGTKVKNIRPVDGDHDIDCKIDGIGAMKLKVRQEGLSRDISSESPAFAGLSCFRTAVTASPCARG